MHSVCVYSVFARVYSPAQTHIAPHAVSVGYVRNYKDRCRSSLACGEHSAAIRKTPTDARSMGMKKPPKEGGWKLKGGQRGSRTLDTRIFSPLLYQLSYLTICACLSRRIRSSKRKIVFYGKWQSASIAFFKVSKLLRHPQESPGQTGTSGNRFPSRLREHARPSASQGRRGMPRTGTTAPAPSPGTVRPPQAT